MTYSGNGHNDEEPEVQANYTPLTPGYWEKDEDDENYLMDGLAARDQMDGDDDNPESPN